MEISGKTAVITGGASGLGEATVRRLARMGANVVIFDLNAERGNAVAAELGPNVMFQSVNVTSEESVAAAIAATMERFGAIHICCNYAGIGNALKTLGKQGVFPLAEFNKVIQINLVGTFRCIAKSAAGMMTLPVLEDGDRGAIVNTASVAAEDGQMGQAAYSASKGGVVGMTLPIARDLASENIRVNTILPGIFDTPLLAGAPQNVRDALGASVLNPKRLGNPAEYANLAMTMIENGYFNGEDVRLDGGIRMTPR